MIKAIIVDDEKIVRNVIKKVGLWQTYDIEIVKEASDGIEALDFILKNEVDLALIDMKMPGMSGMELLFELSERNISINVIVISGYDYFIYAKAALEFGAVSYLLKPIDRNELNKTLLKVYNFMNNKTRVPGQVAPYKDILIRIKERIDKEYASELSLSELSKEYYISKEALSRAFKKRFGSGLTTYINSVRLEQSKVYLLSGYSCGQTAEKTGFKDVNYFSRLFKKTYNLSPTEFVNNSSQ